MIETQIAKELIVLRMIGRITVRDWQGVTAAFEDAGDVGLGLHLRRHGSGTLSVLMDWEDLEGWEEGARTACTTFCMGYQDLVRRIAVVGSDAWRNEGERLADVYRLAQVSFFPPSSRDAAMAWLEGR
jgi:Protein of unknown function (DUF3478).